jgi:site-specific DNA recombinase
MSAIKKSKTKLQLEQFAKGTKKSGAIESAPNCVIYTRVSSKEQQENNKSLEWQKKYCDEFAKRNNYVVLEHFGGTYESAKNDDRMEFNRMLNFVKAKKNQVKHILVYSIDRFSRTGESAIGIVEELKKIGVLVISVSQPVDTSTSSGTLQQSMGLIFSWFDNDLRRQKTIDGMRAKLQRGEWIGHAPTGYTILKGTEKQTIVVNENGELIKKAFVWRSNGMTHEEIISKLKVYGFRLSVKTLSGILKNPFYCGLMAHSHLDGELAKGNHEAIIDEELFMKVNNLNKKSGCPVKPNNENLTLKGFVKEAVSGAPFTGYISKKGGSAYYKVNKIGVKVNRSAKHMNERFEVLLSKFTISPKLIEPLKVQLKNTWHNLTESNTKEKKVLAMKHRELEDKLYGLRKRHAMGEIDAAIYNEFSAELIKEKNDVSTQLEKLAEKLSNHSELINFALKMSTNLNKMWKLGDFYQKKLFQTTLFPDGLVYDTEKNDYRTPNVNLLISYISRLSKDLEQKKSEISQNFSEKSRSVPGAGVEPARG